MQGEIFAVLTILAGIGVLVAFFDWIRRNAADALQEPIVGDVIELPQGAKAGSSKRLTGEEVGARAGPSGRHENNPISDLGRAPL